MSSELPPELRAVWGMIRSDHCHPDYDKIEAALVAGVQAQAELKKLDKRSDILRDIVLAWTDSDEDDMHKLLMLARTEMGLDT